MKRVSLIFILLMTFTLAAHADIVTVNFVGTVTAVGGTPNINVGSAISGSYSYDTGTSGYFNEGFRYHTYNLSTFTIAVESLNLASYPLGEFRVADNYDIDGTVFDWIDVL